jgi:hypothetical protein
MTSTWTLAMAERAGLANKQNWKRYPEAMLWARAVSQLCRMLFADCFAGATYTTEELGAEQTDAAGIPAGDGPITTDVEDDGLFPPLEPEVVEPDTPRMASAAQRTLLWTVTRGAGVPEEHLRALVEQTTGQRSTKEIPAARFEEILAGAERLAAVAELDGATKLLLAHADETGNRAEVEAAIAANRDRHGADVVSHVCRGRLCVRRRGRRPREDRLDEVRPQSRREARAGDRRGALPVGVRRGHARG